MTEIMTMMIIWLVVLILAVVVEVLTLGLATIWFAGGALAAIVATLLHAPIAIQVILFFIVSLLLLFFTRPVAVKYFNKDRVRTNVESMVGRQAIVVSEINNIQGTAVERKERAKQRGHSCRCRGKYTIHQRSQADCEGR